MLVLSGIDNFEDYSGFGKKKKKKGIGKKLKKSLKKVTKVATKPLKKVTKPLMKITKPITKPLMKIAKKLPGGKLLTKAPGVALLIPSKKKIKKPKPVVTLPKETVEKALETATPETRETVYREAEKVSGTDKLALSPEIAKEISKTAEPEVQKEIKEKERTGIASEVKKPVVVFEKETVDKALETADIKVKERFYDEAKTVSEQPDKLALTPSLARDISETAEPEVKEEMEEEGKEGIATETEKTGAGAFPLIIGAGVLAYFMMGE